MKPVSSLFILAILLKLCSCGQADQKARNGLTGNNIAEWVQDKKDKQYYTDPVDDTTSFKKITDNIYKDESGKVYILTGCGNPVGKDTFLYSEYYKDISGFLDPGSYRQIREGYFQNKGKVYLWWSNSDGDYPVEVTGADPGTFVPFDSVAGGTDGQHVFYGGVPGNFKIIEGADHGSVRVLNPESGCWNCGSCYFADNSHVYYGLDEIAGADPETFRLINTATADAADKKGKYFEGRLIK